MAADERNGDAARPPSGIRHTAGKRRERRDVPSRRSQGSTPTVRGDAAGYWAAVVVPFGHLTHFMHIFHESHVPSQQT
jgi:hypothetical protein